VKFTKRFRGYILRISTDRPACGVPKLLGKKVSYVNVCIFGFCWQVKIWLGFLHYCICFVLWVVFWIIRIC